MKRPLSFLCIICLLSACKDEMSIPPDYLEGKWVVIEAMRDGKLTNTLDGAFFNFGGIVMTTNFLGVEHQAEFKLKNNDITLTKGLDYTFHLKKLGNNTLELKTEIQKTEFIFKMKKE